MPRSEARPWPPCPRSFLLPPILRTRAVGGGWESAARLAYPLADLVLTGFAVVLWGAGRWRFDAWFGLAAGFALIAVSDSVYVLAQTGEGWAPGSLGDLGYVAGSMLLAVAAVRSQPRLRDVPGSRVFLPIAFTVTSFALVCYEAFVDLDALAVVLIRLTLLAVVLRLGLTLWWLSRQRADLEALAASAPLTGLGNYRAFQEQLAAAVAAVLRPALSCSTSTTSRCSTTPLGTLRATGCCRRPRRRCRGPSVTPASSRASAARSSRSSSRGPTSGPRPRSRSTAAPRSPAHGPRCRARLLGRRLRLPGPRHDGPAAAAGRGRRAVLGEALGPQSRPHLRPAPRGRAVAGRAAARDRGHAGDRGADRPRLPADHGGRHRPRRR